MSRAITILFLFVISQQNIFAETLQNTSSITPAKNLCPASDSLSAQHTQPLLFSPADSDNTEITADSTESNKNGDLSLDGNVVIEQHLLRITADHVNYSKQTDTLALSGNVHVDSKSISLDADTGTVNMAKTKAQETTRGKFNDLQFLIPNSNMKGKAKTITTGGNTNKENISTLKQTSITSCDLFDPDWLITADEIRLDHDDEYGSADDVVIRFKGVPFLYTPYMEFPTSDRRRSGLLFPEFGTSSSRGVELAVPWYWNIAPNHDAVITPRYMNKRGVELGTDYRYLTESTNGKLKGAYLPNDDVTEESRYQLRYQQHSRILSNLSLDLDIQDISDEEYFNDFSNDLGTTSQTHLNRTANLRYNLDNWRMRALLQDIKTINESTAISNRPYNRLPQLTLNGDTAIADSLLLFTLDSEFVEFAHDDETKVAGARFTIRPGLRLPLSGASWFLEPAVKFSHTQYDVGTNNAPSQIVEDRNLPISSIDAGLFFERSFGNGFEQTLEPRLYYLNVPFEEQDETPLFDTSIPEFSVSQLFRDNRFVGGDRIGDANQLTLALTSRILNTDTGDELIRASIGQVFYFEDREVSLNGVAKTEKRSDIIAELDTSWGDWQTNIDLQWDATENTLAKENYFLHYKSDANHLFNIGYRKRLANNTIDIEQVDTSFVYAITKKYSSYVRWNYSFKDNQDIDTIVGLSYDSCCWSIQLLTQRRLLNTTSTDAYDNSILVQFVFKGLGSISGNKARNTLERSIYGYSTPFQ